MAIVTTVVDTTLRHVSTGGSTATFTGVPLGTAFAGRVIAIDLNIDGSNDITAVTINGVSASITVNSAGTGMAAALVPYGTVATVVVTFSGTDGCSIFGVWSLAGALPTPASTSSVSSTNQVTLTVPAGGAMLAHGFGFGASGTGTWTNATKDWDTSDSGSYQSGAHFDNSGSSASRTMTYTSPGASFQMMNAMAFSPLPAVAIDHIGTQQGTLNSTLVTSYNYTGFTVNSLANSALVVAVAINSGNINPTPTGITAVWDSAGVNQSMTLIGSETDPVTNDWVGVFALLNPTPGASKTISFNWTNASSFGATAIQFYNVAQSGYGAAFPHTATNSGTSGTGTVAVTSTTSNYCLALFQSYGSLTTPSDTTFFDMAGGTIYLQGSNCLFEYGVGAATKTITSAINANWSALAIDIAQAGLGIQKVQSAETDSSGATTASSVAATFSAAVRPGDAVCGQVSWGSGSLTSVTDDKGNTYNLETTYYEPIDDQYYSAFSRTNITNSPTVITANFSISTSYREIIIDEFSGISTASSDERDVHGGQVQTSPGTGTDAITSGNFTTTFDNDLLWGGQAGTYSSNRNPGTGFSAGASTTASGNGPTASTEYRVQATAGSGTAATFTQPNGSQVVTFLIALKPFGAAGGGGTGAGSASGAATVAGIGAALATGLAASTGAGTASATGLQADRGDSTGAGVASATGISGVVLVPDADSSTGTWTNEAAGATLYTSVDEFLTPNDTDYIQSATDPVNDTCQMTLSNPVSGITSPIHVAYRYRAEGKGPVELRVRLMQGATEIASWTHRAIDVFFTTVTQTLTSDQLALITDANSLSVEIRANKQ